MTWIPSQWGRGEGLEDEGVVGSREGKQPPLLLSQACPVNWQHLEGLLPTPGCRQLSLCLPFAVEGSEGRDAAFVGELKESGFPFHSQGR